MRKIIFRVFLSFLLLLAVFLVLVIGVIDVTPLNDLPEVKNTMKSIDDRSIPSGKGHALGAGWAKANITPYKPLNMAGYGRQPEFTSVHDSLFARVVVLGNGTFSAAVISLDMIMFPKTIRKQLKRKLEEAGIDIDFLYFTATHTHSSFGNFDPSPAGEIIFGDYDEKNALFLMEKLTGAIASAKRKLLPVTIAFQKIDARGLAYNRLAGKGRKDGWLRVIYLKNEKGETALITAFSGHPVNLDSDIPALSRDYPGVLVDALEKVQDVDFAMFCAGMVGSHNIKLDMPKGYERAEKAGKLLSEKVFAAMGNMPFHKDSLLRGIDVRVGLPPSQMRIAKNLRIRDWLFRVAFGPLEADVQALQIGDILLLGMPCDFSGEISMDNLFDTFTEKHGEKLFITSFNGNYIGYITADRHYPESDHDEVRIMNWVGPYKGQYFAEIVRKLVVKFSTGQPHDPEPAASATPSK